VRIRKPWLIAVLVIVGVGASREFGWASLNAYTSKLAEESDTTTRDMGDKVFASTVTVNDASELDGHSVRAAVSQGGDDFRGEITEFELSGPYWLPLIKSGELAYKARITRNGEVVGDASGTMTLKVWGLCSVYEFRKQAHEAVEKNLHASIESRVSR